MKIMCILPTGDWCFIGKDQQPVFVAVSDAEAKDIEDGVIGYDEVADLKCPA